MADLTICPREDCTATYRHWHTPTAGVPVECSCLPDACTHTGTPAATSCHEPRPQADLTEPVDLPTAKELASLIWNVSRRDEGTISATGADHVAEAALDLIRERLAPAEWQPIAFADIKPGMRVRMESRCVESTLTVADTGSRWLYTVSKGSILDHEGTVWHVDSRTVPKPEDPRVERAAQALYEAERDSTRPGWQDVTDKTRDKHLKRARVAVAAIDEAVKSDD